MGFFANLRAKLSIDTSSFDKGLRAASSASDRFAKKVANDFKTTTKSATSASKSFKIFGDAADKGYKSVKRIAQGILFSQAFYKTVHAIQGATKELYSFSQAVEESRVAFEGLIGDADKAKRFNDTLQDLAADTPFTYEQAADNARMLLAYEFKLQNMERIMRSIADATSASGKTESYSNISEALGQIQAKGKLTSRELIRLANAGIPAYQILREELGMTHEQIANLGKTPVPAEVAIPAILRGMDKRYGGAAAAMQRTTKGLANAIKENLLIIGQNAFDPMYQNFRVNMEKVANKLESMRDDVRKGGIGGMLSNMFPPEIFQKIQLFAANIKMLIQNIVMMFRSLAPFRHAFNELFLNTINAVLPIINMFMRILAVLMQIISSNSTAVRIFTAVLGGLFIVNAIIKKIIVFEAALKSLLIVKVIAQGIVYLSKAIGFLTGMISSNPLVAFIAMALGGIVAMTLASKKFGGVVDNLMGKFSGAFGVDPSKVFAPKMEDNTKIAGEFNQELDLSSKGLKKMGDKAKEAGKKAKQALMSFDEVFVLPEPDAGADGLDDAFNIPDIEVPSIPPFDASGMFPDVGASITEWTQGIADQIKTKLRNALIGMGIGGLIGGIIGAAFGDPVLGFKIGSLAGGIVGLFWDDLKKAFETSAGKGALVGAAIGGLIGLAMGNPLAAALLAVIGGGLGMVVSHFWEDIKKAFKTDVGKGALVGAAIGGLIGLAMGNPLAAALLAVLGGVIGGLLPSFWEHVTKWYEESKATFDNWWKGTTEGFTKWREDNTKGIEKWRQDTLGSLGKWVVDSAKGIADWVVASKKDFDTWWTDTKKGFSEWRSGTFKSVSEWYSESAAKLSTWWKETKTGFGTWVEETRTLFKGGFDTKLTDTAAWAVSSVKKFTGWSSETMKGFKEWIRESEIGFGKWVIDTVKSIGDWSKDTGGKLGTWVKETYDKLDGWWEGNRKGFATWGINTLKDVSDWATKSYAKLSDWWGDSKKGFSEWWEDSKRGFSEWASDIYHDVIGWFDDMWKKLKDFFEDLKFWKKEAKEEEINIKNSVPAPSRSRGGGGGGGAGGIRMYSMDPVMMGHAKGGTFKKEHIAKFNEGNKMETILPVENPSAMAKVRQAIFGGEPVDMLRSLVAEAAYASQPVETTSTPVTPIYVNTLIADDRGIRELERKMYEIRQIEKQRRGE